MGEPAPGGLRQAGSLRQAGGHQRDGGVLSRCFYLLTLVYCSTTKPAKSKLLELEEKVKAIGNILESFDHHKVAENVREAGVIVELNKSDEMNQDQEPDA